MRPQLPVSISREEIITIVRLAEQSACSDFELIVGDVALRLGRKPAASAQPWEEPAKPEAAVRSESKPLSSASASVQTTAATQPQTQHTFVDGFQLKAPMLGIFYRAPSPDAPPFVEVGDKVEVGTTLCIIEVMKVMNTVKADRPGVVGAICADNAAIVEFGQTIIIISAEPVA
jgi:acetyl-CoA carboxylase biotin carboxyl carrier protein